MSFKKIHMHVKIFYCYSVLYTVVGLRAYIFLTLIKKEKKRYNSRLSIKKMLWNFIRN